MSILDGLAAAAAEMADPRKAPQLALQGPQHAPELLPPAAAGHRAKLGAGSALKAGFLQPRAVKSAAADETSNGSADGSLVNASINRADSGGSGVCSGTVNRPASSSEKAQAAPGLVETSSRVWGKVSLQKQTQAAGNNSSRKTFRNRFAPVALRWTTALLQQCDVKQQGVDLFGRDSVLLGRLLTVLGSFVEAAAETPAAVPLCAGLLELLKAGEVSSHKEVSCITQLMGSMHLTLSTLCTQLNGRGALWLESRT
jgi:telomere length regulation protein